MVLVLTALRVQRMLWRMHYVCMLNLVLFFFSWFISVGKFSHCSLHFQADQSVSISPLGSEIIITIRDYNEIFLWYVNTQLILHKWNTNHSHERKSVLKSNFLTSHLNTNHENVIPLICHAYNISNDLNINN